MSRLENILIRNIQSNGPMDLGRFMDLCLTHPDYGYYVTRDPLGSAGDFTTAPEISQMFGEMIGVWTAILWNNIGMPDSLNIMELGPGRGTLMADLLRGSRHIPGFHDGLKIHFVEKSPVLQEKQKEAVDGAGFKAEEAKWYDDVGEFRDRAPVIIIANEFIDALPIRQLEFTDAGWMERSVGYEYQEGFFFGLAPANDAHAALMPKHPKIGDIYEFSPARDAYLERIINVIGKQGGAALFIDYGYDQKYAAGDTFQAMSAHDYIDPFKQPGQSDLTAHVDFYRIGEIARANKCEVYGSVMQGDFLHGLGIGKRAEMLVKNAGDKGEEIYQAYQRLTAKGQMGDLFRVIAIAKNLDGEPLI